MCKEGPVELWKNKGTGSFSITYWNDRRIRFPVPLNTYIFTHQVSCIIYSDTECAIFCAQICIFIPWLTTSTLHLFIFSDNWNEEIILKWEELVNQMNPNWWILAENWKTAFAEQWWRNPNLDVFNLCKLGRLDETISEEHWRFWT